MKEQDAFISTGEVLNQNVPLSEQRYRMRTIKQETGNIIPSLGITMEF